MKFFLKYLLFVICFFALIAPFTFLIPPSNKDNVLKEINRSKKPKKIIVEQPRHSVNLPDFESILDIPTKKQTFFDFLKPAIIKANHELLSQRQELLVIHSKQLASQPLSESELLMVSKLTKKYKIKNNKNTLTQQQRVNALLKRVDIVPVELILVQAANESAWGTSRFTRIGLNFFGLWCYKKGCGMVPNARDIDGRHEVAVFESMDNVVEYYLYNINTHYAYSVFRLIRQQLRAHQQPLTPEILATGLLPYSERGIDYVTEIIDMLRHNEEFINQ